MDYYIATKNFAPPGLFDAQFTEKLVYLSSAAAFEPDPNSPVVNALPGLNNESFTFGSFNRVSKAGDAVFALWASILKAVPKSRLLLGNMHGASMTQEITARFVQHNIEADRLILCDRTTINKYLELHHRVDLLLDTFPYTGGTTTFHGLWMGVPTITLAGKTLAGRSGAAIMSQYSLGEFVANDQSEYLEKAVNWAQRQEDLSVIRSSMRERIENNATYSKEFIAKITEKALRKTWEIWCSGKSPESFEVEG
jgi:predicted O-linked N-acetylglucosamine transferase (SPINDLY family)